MVILGIDTSCDETSTSVLKIKDGKLIVLSNIVSSQVKLHSKYGGVYPSLAKREHQKNILPVFKEAIKKAGIKGKELPKIKKYINNRENEIAGFFKEKELADKFLSFISKNKIADIDYIAVTVGPGLDPCLWVGINFAKALAFSWQKPLLPINHIEGHILSFLLPKGRRKLINIRKKLKEVNLPIISLVVSGGHTELVFSRELGRKYKIIGETRDDAAGECFDKIARILGLGYPGGPAISKKAAEDCRDCQKITLPRPMIHSKNYDFSFSGLKTAVFYKNRETEEKTENYIRAMARESEKAIIDVLVKKTISAAKEFKAKSVILSGGVSANKLLRASLKKECAKNGLLYFQPELDFSTDNGAMVAIAGFFRRENAILPKKEKLKRIKSMPNLKIK